MGFALLPSKMTFLCNHLLHRPAIVKGHGPKLVTNAHKIAQQGQLIKFGFLDPLGLAQIHETKKEALLLKVLIA